MTTRISTLPSLATVTDATIIPVVEGGATKKITGLSLKTYTGTASGPQGPSGPSGAAGSNGASGPSGPSGPGTLNSGTAGYIPYYSANTTLSSSGSGGLFYDATNGRLGIGTSGPAVPLEIDKNNGEALRLSATGANQSIYSRYITGSPGVGNVYVGVDSAAGGITGVGNAGYIWNAGNAGIAIGTNNATRATWNELGRTYFSSAGDTTAGAKAFQFIGGTDIGSASSMQFGMWVSQAGARYTDQTGIYGLAGPNAVNSTGAYASIYRGIWGDSSISTQAGMNASGVYGSVNCPDWNYGGICAGIRGLSTPGSPTFSNTYGLNVNNGGFGGHFVAHGKSDSCGVYADAYLDASPGSGTVARPLVCGTNGSFVMYVSTNGGISNYSSNNTNLSDQREKKNISIAGNYLDKLCAIPVKTFLYVTDDDSESLNLGVIAQDVQAIAPELITEDAWPTESEPDRKRLAVYQTDVQYAMLRAIQELNAKHEALYAEFNAYRAAHP